MLITKGIQAGEVITLKLTSGEEVIAKLVEVTDTGYKLSKPMVLTMGQQGIGMVPYLITVDPDRDVTMSKATVTVTEPTDASAAAQYIQATTGLVTAG